MITLTYSLSQDAFIAAARDVWTHDAIGDRGNWILAALTFAVGATLLFFDFATGWIWLVASALLVGFTLLRPVLWRRGFANSVKYSAPITATFDADTIKTTSAEGKGTLSWDAFHSFLETPEFFLLFVGRRNFSVLPKSAIATPQDVDTLRSLIIANLPLKKRRWI